MGAFEFWSMELIFQNEGASHAATIQNQCLISRVMGASFGNLHK